VTHRLSRLRLVTDKHYSIFTALHVGGFFVGPVWRM